MLEVARASRGAGSEMQDRLAAITVPDATVIVVADGAGGVAGGAEAAELVLEFLSDRAAALASSAEPADLAIALADLDLALLEHTRAGWATAVVVVANAQAVWGASAGDSQAWLIRGDTTLDLTSARHPKPLLGSGEAVPVGFGPLPFLGRLLVATDGLFDYVDPKRIIELAGSDPLQQTAEKLIEAARLPSGGLWNDVAVIVCRLKESDGGSNGRKLDRAPEAQDRR
jgi:serine/threonine protein phosphatase PrpC